MLYQTLKNKTDLDVSMLQKQNNFINPAESSKKKHLIRGSIGGKVYSSLFILTIIFAVFLWSNLSALSVIEDYDNTNYVYTQIAQYNTDLVEAFHENQLYTDLCYYAAEEDVLNQCASQIEVQILDMQESIAEIAELGDSVDDAKLLELCITWEEAVNDYCKKSSNIASIIKEGNLSELNSAVVQADKSMTILSEINDSALTLISEEQAYFHNKSQIKINGTYIFNWCLVAVYFMVQIIVCIVINKTVAKNAKTAGAELDSIVEKIDKNQGDLTERVSVKTIDEVGKMAAGINNFICQLQNVILKLKDISEQLNTSADAVNSRLSESNDSASSVSATMEELSASMEEISATLNQMADGSRTVLDEAKSMADKAGDGNTFVSGIKNKAAKMHQDTLKGKASAEDVVAAMTTAVTQSVEESKNVSQINELTDEILNISSQTNLLALNASIEAARAGDAGKGFSVVANEIRILAENSKSTANNIQLISDNVTTAVNKLADSTRELLDFVNNSVLTDYDNFAGIVEQYSNDADSMSRILAEFNEIAVEINKAVESMKTGIDDINIAVDESAKGIAGAAESTVNLADAISQIQRETENNQQISKELHSEVNRFKNV